MIVLIQPKEVCVARFAFVCGDIGGARMQLPVIEVLHNAGHEVQISVDATGMGQKVFAEANLEHWPWNSSEDTFVVLHGCDLAFISTCASAKAAGIHAAEEAAKRMPVVIGADGLFNHALPAWRSMEANLWFAITQGHADAIRTLRGSSANVVVVGQPAFDNLADLAKRKQEVRTLRRRELGIPEDAVVALWWSQGMPEVLEVDISLALEAIRVMSRHQALFIPRIHPKIDKIREGYVREVRGRIYEQARESNVPLIVADQMPGEELNLAADVIFSVTCTEDVKNVMIGGPPVVHFVTPPIQRWLSEDLFLSHPYFPDIKEGRSLGVFTREEMGEVIARALDPTFAEALQMTVNEAALGTGAQTTARELVRRVI